MKKRTALTGTQNVLKELNSSLIKDALAKCGQATRVELAAMTKISQPTVNLLIKTLLADQTVISLGAAASTGGRRAEVYALNHKKSGVALITVNERFFETSVIDMELKEEVHGRSKRDREEDCLRQIEEILEKLIRQNQNIRAISVGVPGAVTAGGEVFAVPSVPEWENFPLRETLEEYFNLPVQVTNDINATAAGYTFVHPGVRNMVYVSTDGEGIGAGVILNGELYPGCKSFAGELGYMQLGGCSVEELMAEKKGRQESSVWLSQIVVNIACMFNPEEIVFAGDADREEVIRKVEEICRKLLPERVIPRIGGAGKEQPYYFKGLGRLGCELLNQDIHIV